MARNSFQKSLKNNGSLKVEAVLTNSQDFGNGKELKVIEFARAVHRQGCQNSGKQYLDPEDENLRNPCTSDCYEGKLRISLNSDVATPETFLIFVEESWSIDGGFSLILERSFDDPEEATHEFGKLIGMNLLDNLYR